MALSFAAEMTVHDILMVRKMYPTQFIAELFVPSGKLGMVLLKVQLGQPLSPQVTFQIPYQSV